MSEKSRNSTAEKPAVSPKPLLPPDERFWHRYSPHQEFPLSSAMSILAHALAIGVLVAAAFLVARSQEADQPIEVGSVDPGGGGDVQGTEGSAGGEPLHGPETAENVKTPRSPAPKPEKEPNLKAPTPAAPDMPAPADDASSRIIAESSSAFEGLQTVNDEAKRQLARALGPGPDKGQGGPGKGGGTGSGIGKGRGAGIGEGTGSINTRVKRKLRWQLNFSVRGPEDHLRQFSALGAILAVPERNGRYRVFRDLLRRPLRGRDEDVSKINRIWFVDEQPDTVGEIAAFLGMPGAPHLVAFFPEKLEKEMVRKEEEYRGRKEADIDSREKIMFQVVPTGSGNYEVVVAPNQ